MADSLSISCAQLRLAAAAPAEPSKNYLKTIVDSTKQLIARIYTFALGVINQVALFLVAVKDRALQAVNTGLEAIQSRLGNPSIAKVRALEEQLLAKAKEVEQLLIDKEKAIAQALVKAVQPTVKAVPVAPIPIVATPPAGAGEAALQAALAEAQKNLAQANLAIANLNGQIQQFKGIDAKLKAAEADLLQQRALAARYAAENADIGKQIAALQGQLAAVNPNVDSGQI